MMSYLQLRTYSRPKEEPMKQHTFQIVHVSKLD